MSEPFAFDSFRSYAASFLGLKPDTLNQNTNLYDELCIDSLGVFSLGINLIERFGIKLPLSEVGKIATLGDMYNALDRYRNDGVDAHHEP